VLENLCRRLISSEILWRASSSLSSRAVICPSDAVGAIELMIREPVAISELD
jgi:hypothetical protein